MSAEGTIIKNIKLHSEIMAQLEKMGLNHTDASREALRRMQDAKFKFSEWRDYFTAVEVEGYSLSHR